MTRLSRLAAPFAMVLFLFAAGLVAELNPQPVVIEDGKTAAQDSKLPTGPGLIVQGIVLGLGHKPVSEATVLAELPETSEERRVRADEQGRFHFKALPPGAVLRARAGTMMTVEPTLVDGTGNKISLRLRSAALAKLTGLVTDTADHPIGGARVRVTVRGGPLGSRDEPQFTDEHGLYFLKGLEPDRRYTLDIDADGYGAARAVVTLKWGMTNEQPTVTLKKATNSIRGRVVTPHGDPARGIRVEINGAETGQKFTSTDKNGRFSFDVVDGALVMLGLRTPAGTSVSHPRLVKAGEDGIELRLPPDEDSDR